MLSLAQVLLGQFWSFDPLGQVRELVLRFVSIVFQECNKPISSPQTRIVLRCAWYHTIFTQDRIKRISAMDRTTDSYMLPQSNKGTILHRR